MYNSRIAWLADSSLVLVRRRPADKEIYKAGIGNLPRLGGEPTHIWASGPWKRSGAQRPSGPALFQLLHPANPAWKTIHVRIKTPMLSSCFRMAGS